jgi:cysteine desulfurase/selenocysteine lyase
MIRTSSTPLIPRRLYMDNAATSFPKPPGVLEAMVRYATELGASAGRGAYQEAVETSQLITECRQRLNRLFHGERAEHFIFTLNCSDSLNLAMKGLIDPAAGRKNHAICTHIDHNSILRPLNALADDGWLEQTRVGVESSSGLVDPEEIRKALRPQTRFIAITHVSNVTGTVQPIREIGRIARQAGVPLIVDAAQSAGHVPIDVQEDLIDFLAAPGHKGLLGPLGTGLLYIRPGLEKGLRPLKQGGTGSVSESDWMPDFLPDKYEPGSHNAIGIIALSQGVRWVSEQTVAKLAAHDLDLVRTMIEGLGSIDGLTYFGPQGVRHRVGVFSIRLEGLEPHELSAVLEQQYGILTRPGLHCAPLAHQAIGTADSGGTTRLSFGPFLSTQDVKFACDALAEIQIQSRQSAVGTGQ